MHRHRRRKKLLRVLQCTNESGARWGVTKKPGHSDANANANKNNETGVACLNACYTPTESVCVGDGPAHRSLEATRVT